MHERGLAGAVLANESVKFAGPHTELDLIDRKNARGLLVTGDRRYADWTSRLVLADALRGDLVDISFVDADARIDALGLPVQELHEKVHGSKPCFSGA
jgi:hypothetical protein